MTRRFAAVVLLAALAGPAAAVAAWLPSATTHACALACPLGHGAACCEPPQNPGRGPSFHRCAREETALAPSTLPPALPVVFARSVRPGPSKLVSDRSTRVAVSAFSLAIDHVPLLLA